MKKINGVKIKTGGFFVYKSIVPSKYTKKRAFFESSLNFIIYYFVIGSSNGLAGKSPELYRFTSGSASQAYLTN